MHLCRPIHVRIGIPLLASVHYAQRSGESLPFSSACVPRKRRVPLEISSCPSLVGSPVYIYTHTYIYTLGEDAARVGLFLQDATIVGLCWLFRISLDLDYLWTAKMPPCLLYIYIYIHTNI